jgi:hypothetical protein
VSQTSTGSGRVVALAIYGLFDASDVVAMTERVSKEAAMMIELDDPWVIKGFELFVPKDDDQHRILVLEFMEKDSIEPHVAELSPEQKVKAMLSCVLGLDFKR